MGNVQILLRQHVGAPCEAIVKAGDKVEKGTLIATPTGLGANIFSSVYGVVEEVTADSIIIKPDDEQKDEFVPIKEGTKLEMVKEAGIVGMGGAGFPTGVKLNINLAETPMAELDPEINPELPADFKLEHSYILVNAAECEPGLEHNIQQLEQQTDKVIRGVKYCMEITHADKAIFAIKKKHHNAIKILDAALKSEPDISIHMLADIYPMGEERAVVRECLGVNLTTTQLPSAARSVVVNLETAAKVAEAIDERKPCISKNMTVRGKLNGGNGAHVFMDVPIGVSVGEMIEKAGGIDGVYGEIIMGGAFTGKSTDLDAPTTKTTGGILVTGEFPDLHGANVGILVCACGGSEERMREIAAKMNGNVVSVCKCKQAIENKPGAPLKCLRPGNCPGQVKNNLQFKKDNCEYIIIGNCSDCSNTVMASAPKMGLKVFHQTDHVMRTIGHPLYRTLKISKEVSQEIDF
ncbi:proline reductase-associated electron transfer protein PrdC [Claveliimonas bilis]|uniref:Proline reductase-associated electron transfer protein PrdC n=1 Tax=Claveliimonas bilis TaxID=3028070 RepID=A0ABN6Z0D1_9FIRM|nr:proline reductase-associated electron transfer protein PrdC [Claveliimonas bilis]BDZ76570.1 proline reductase-associated electron transfer protein PrdC [Claveliimonas bilis]BDZ79529.1 proline reductase-associated electron transfer protein PrdC [Claveliimonas bilis]